MTRVGVGAAFREPPVAACCAESLTLCSRPRCVQLNMPESTAQRPLSQPKAQVELNQLRAGNAGKPQPAAATKAAEDVAADLAKVMPRASALLNGDISKWRRPHQKIGCLAGCTAPCSSRM